MLHQMVIKALPIILLKFDRLSKNREEEEEEENEQH